MPKVTFVLSTGERYEVDGQCGMSVMEAAVHNAVPGILADCGGCLTCGTCQGYVPADWVERMPTTTPAEKTILEGAIGVTPLSRLTCQISLTEELDGLIVQIPPSQTA